MAESKQAIIAKIENYITNNGAVFKNWYVGIAAKPRERLFYDHNVKGTYTIGEAENDTIAREVEKHFINVKGTQGGPGGGDSDTRYVYAYKITSDTIE